MVDCGDVERVAAFWSSLLGLSVTKRWRQYVILESRGGAPALSFQQVPESKASKNRVHVDISVDDLDVATDRAIRLGATVLGEITDDGVTARVLADPEGNEFCFVGSVHNSTRPG